MEPTHQHADEHHGDHGGLAKYVYVFLALCFLTSLSFMTVADFWPFAKTPTWIFMMGVSSAKAMLVILCFMHLWWEANWKYVLTIPAAMMSVFLLLMLVPDVGCRGTHYSEERIIHAASADGSDEHHEAHDDGGHADHEAGSDQEHGGEGHAADATH